MTPVAGNTPLDPDEAAGLIPSHITTQAQLNEWEQQNILEGERWAFAREHAGLLTVPFLRELHRRMFGDTWKWAGRLRTTERNIGIEPGRVAPELQTLCDDARAQLEQKALSLDEIAARFHHRLVSIHPFANGNGRHSRTMTDLLLVSNAAARFSWGGGADLVGAGQARERYLAALRAADKRDFGPLLAFVRS